MFFMATFQDSGERKLHDSFIFFMRTLCSKHTNTDAIEEKVTIIDWL